MIEGFTSFFVVYVWQTRAYSVHRVDVEGKLYHRDQFSNMTNFILCFTN